MRENARGAELEEYDLAVAMPKSQLTPYHQFRTETNQLPWLDTVEIVAKVGRLLFDIDRLLIFSSSHG